MAVDRIRCFTCRSLGKSKLRSHPYWGKSCGLSKPGMLNFTDISIRRGTRVLFEKATFNLYRGEKVGITGENGSGKSTLLALVRGEVAPESGSFDMPGNLAVAYVAQELGATGQAAIEFVLDGDAELRTIERQIAAAEAADDGHRLAELYGNYDAIGGYHARSRAATLLHGLGFTTDDEQRAVSAFSGGWRVRLNVAQALMCRSDLLLLDEPTNHLDLDAVLWLEQWLKDYRGTLLLIAHDRDFLDQICNRIVNIEQGRIDAYRGNYSAFEEARAARLAQNQALYVRQQREIEHIESFINRFRAKASKARQAQSRIKALERMQRIAPAHVDSEFTFSFPEPHRLPRPLLTLDDQAAGYGGVALVEGISVTISPGARVALLGHNGAGKSTVIKLLAGELPALGGERVEARDLRIGYFAQHQLEQLREGESPLQHLLEMGGPEAARATEQELRDFLGSFGFRGDRVFEAIGPFSGGEKARLVLALLTYLRPNLLLLDEPTNHLDLEMRQALARALQDYSGAVLMVSHDRHLLRTVIDKFYLVVDGRLSPFDGDLDDYARWAADNPKDAPEKTVKVVKVVKAQPVAESRAAQARLAKLDGQLAEMHREQREIEMQLSSADIY
ncbi:MAG TPA: ATP-binding cassette domain-containing protein, partial [Vicinamibacterales bacterium]|nr:ATP-binding cassette domain-containing protein [Vicinamibacterales bacterium]